MFDKCIGSDRNLQNLLGNHRHIAHHQWRVKVFACSAVLHSQALTYIAGYLNNFNSLRFFDNQTLFYTIKARSTMLGLRPSAQLARRSAMFLASLAAMISSPVLASESSESW